MGRIACVIIFLSVSIARGQTLHLPPRAADALTGSAFARAADTMALERREDYLGRQILAGNIPDFLRTLSPVTIACFIGDTLHAATIYVLSDYLSIGSDADFIRMPMMPALAQRIADSVRCMLPTRKIVDECYAAAAVKLRPQPIPPGPAMIFMHAFVQENDSVEAQLKALGPAYARGVLTAGQKKDVVITAAINNPSPTGRVAIYGWHRAMNDPIQPLYIKHKDTWADYSHGIRLVQRLMIVDGREVLLDDVLKDAALAPLVSDEGVILMPRYPVASLPQQQSK
jgi:hypothetical protein